MNTLRLVVAGKYNANEEVVIIEPLFEDTWLESVATSVDAQPKQPEQDFADWHTMGELDYHEGRYDPPKGAADYLDYVQGQNDAWAAQNGRTLLR